MKWNKYPENKPDLKGEYQRNFICYGTTNECCGEKKLVMEATYTYKDIFIYGEYDCVLNVSHWMELPEAPEESNSTRICHELPDSFSMKSTEYPEG